MKTVKISDYLSSKQIILNLKSSKKKETLKELVDVLGKLKRLSPLKKQKFFSSLMAREKLGSTGIGQGVALPHARIENIKKPIVLIGISQKGIDFSSLDGAPVYIIFLIISPIFQEGLHLKLLAKISRLLKDKYFLERLKELRSPQEIIEFIRRQEDS